MGVCMARSEESKQQMKQYNLKYVKENVRQYMFKLNKKLDAELVTYLDGMENRNQYIKDLILKDMENKRVG